MQDFLLRLQTILTDLKKNAQRKKDTKLLERDLPQAIRSIGISLNMNLSFEKAIENVAGAKHAYASKTFKKVLHNMRHAGLSLPQALQKLSEENPSRDVKRTVLHLTNVYEQGNSLTNQDGETLLRLSKELTDKQKLLIKEHSGRIMLYSLLFIVASAVLPALFQVFILVGSNVLELTFTPQDAFLTIALGFPLINTLIILLIKHQTPAILKN